MGTKLERIAEISAESKKTVFTSLYHLIRHQHKFEKGVRYFCARSKEFVLVTASKEHPAFQVDEPNLHIICYDKLDADMDRTANKNTRGYKMNKTAEPNKNKTRDIVFIALFAVLMAVCSWISIPTAIPITMQTFAVFLTLNFLGGKKGTVSVCIYLLLGLIGLPVYAHFTSGIGMRTTGGYMIGWIFSGLVMWLLEKLLGRKLWAQAVSMLIGLTVCYIAGTAWFMVVYAQNTGPVGIWTALLWCVVPFIVPDIVKLGLALWLSQWLSQRLEKIMRSM